MTKTQHRSNNSLRLSSKTWACSGQSTLQWPNMEALTLWPHLQQDNKRAQRVELTLRRRSLFTSWPDRSTCSAEWDYLESVNTGIKRKPENRSHATQASPMPLSRNLPTSQLNPDGWKWSCTRRTPHKMHRLSKMSSKTWKYIRFSPNLLTFCHPPRSITRLYKR